MRVTVRALVKSAALAIAASALMGAVASAAEPTKEDPAAMVATLEKQAADLRASAARHDSMAKAHRGGGGSPKVNHEGIVKHCEAIAKDLRAAADESDKLAAEYRKEAAK